MRRAKIFGEIHQSEGDIKRLRDEDLDEYDALFIEGRDKLKLRENLTVKFLLYAVGYYLYRVLLWILEKLNKIRNFGNSEQDKLFEEAEGKLQIHNRIDADSTTIFYELLKDEERNKLFGIPIILALVSIYSIFYISTYVAIASLVSVPFSYFGVVVLYILKKGGRRNQYMVDSITEKCDEQDYHRIMILCGQSHVYGIKDLLEQRGWEVDPNDSEHWLNKHIYENLKSAKSALRQ